MAKIFTKIKVLKPKSTSTPRWKISIKPNFSKLRKTLIVAALAGAIGVGGYREIVVKPKQTAKIEYYRKIAESKTLTNKKPQNLESFYTDEVLSIFSPLVSKGPSKVKQQDINLANNELLKHKGVVYFDPVDGVVVLRPYTDFGKTQSEAYNVIKEAKGFRRVWLDKKAYVPAYDARTNLNSKKPNFKLIRRNIEKANDIIMKNGGLREIRLETVQDKSNTLKHRLVLYNKLTAEKVYDF